MANESKRVVRDFFRGMKIFGLTLFWGFLGCFLIVSLAQGPYPLIMDYNVAGVPFVALILLFIILLAIVAFFVNYVPIKVINGVVSIPASDQIRTFTDLITINPITGLYRRRTYKVEKIENVANGYTRILKGKERSWNVVISGVKNGRSFSQRIDCSNKQSRDEVRNTLKQTIKGHVNSDFAI